MQGGSNKIDIKEAHNPAFSKLDPYYGPKVRISLLLQHRFLNLSL